MVLVQLNSQIWNIPSLPDNPTVAVAPFLPEEPDGSLPSTGRVISEVMTLALWQLPSLNMYHHWLLARDSHHLRQKLPTVSQYALKFMRRHGVQLLIAGTYRRQGNSLRVKVHVLKEEKKGVISLCKALPAEGDYEDLPRWLTYFCFHLVERILPGCASPCEETPLMLDAPIAAIEWVCAALDYASLDAVYDSAAHYLQKAQKEAPDSAYVRFASTIAGDELRDVDTCKEVLRKNPDFLPAYFPDGSVRTDDYEELAEAKKLYLQGLSRSPLNMHGYFGLREICVRQGDADTLIPFAKLHTVRGTFSSQSNQFGDTFLQCMEKARQHEQYEMARRLFEAAIEMIDDPDQQAKLLKKRGQIEEWDSDTERAIWFYEQSLQLKRSLRLMTHIADLHLGQGRISEAESLYLQALSAGKRLSRTRRIEAQFGLARCYEERGMTWRAGKIYKKLSKQAASNGSLYPLLLYACDWLRRNQQ
ncbi:MAG: tetratricopeptide repeat protein [Armatimonadota bacterium]|nr:tetratricopeptide repeat protein [bacterium]MDW8320920.1 tetratricopeptide repeat protein [Armatimonadota bacterium]